MIPIDPAKNMFRALVSTIKLMIAKKTLDPKSAPAPIDTIIAVSDWFQKKFLRW